MNPCRRFRHQANGSVCISPKGLSSSCSATRRCWTVALVDVESKSIRRWQLQARSITKLGRNFLKVRTFYMLKTALRSVFPRAPPFFSFCNGRSDAVLTWNDVILNSEWRPEEKFLWFQKKSKMYLSWANEYKVVMSYDLQLRKYNMDFGLRKLRWSPIFTKDKEGINHLTLLCQSYFRFLL